MREQCERMWQKVTIEVQTVDGVLMTWMAFVLKGKGQPCRAFDLGSDMIPFR